MSGLYSPCYSVAPDSLVGVLASKTGIKDSSIRRLIDGCQVGDLSVGDDVWGEIDDKFGFGLLQGKHTLKSLRDKIRYKAEVPEDAIFDRYGEAYSIYTDWSMVFPYQWSDDRVDEIWPFRNNSDRVIRCLRIRHAWTALARHRGRVYADDILRQTVGYSQITAMNIMLGCIFLSHVKYDWFETIKNLGWLDYGENWLGMMVKKVNSELKSRGIYDDDLFFMLVENTGVLGYKQPPYPGFDVVVESKGLAESGTDVHGLFGDEVDIFRMVGRRVCSGMVGVSKQKSFREFIYDNDWLTSGASDIGVVEWKSGDESGRFKARKNIVPEVVDSSKLYGLVKNGRFQINKAAIKPELGKIRMMVVGDMNNYLRQTYLVSLLDSSYKNWQGSTINETTYEELSRFKKMMSDLRGYSLPYDYEGFDHQITTPELVICIEEMFAWCVKLDDDEINQLVRDVIRAAIDAVVKLDYQGKIHTWKVTGGLMSGLRITSMVGNLWNTIMVSWARSICLQLGCDIDGESWIRGDDSSTSGRTKSSMVLLMIVLTALGARGGFGKFSVQTQATEFLRVWYTPNRMRGYPARAVFSLGQRKPWASQAWFEYSEAEHVYDTLRTMRRRLVNPDAIHNFSLSYDLMWSASTKRPAYWLAVPKRAGGLGISFRWLYDVPLRKRIEARLMPIRITNNTGFLSRKLGRMLSDLTPSAGELDVLVTNEQTKLMHADNVSAVYKSFKNREREFYPKTDIVRVKASQIVLLTEISITVDHPESHTRQIGSFGSFESELKWYDDHKGLLMLRGEPVPALFEKFPELLKKVRQLERWGFGRYDALDWLGGKIPQPTPTGLHPSLAGVLTNRIVSHLALFVGSYKWRDWREYMSTVYSLARRYEDKIMSSDLCQRHYLW